MAPLSETSPALRTLVIVCLEDHPKAVTLLRVARKRARETGGQWRAVYIETPERFQQTEEATRERMLRLLTLAKQMGGEAAHIEAANLEQGIASVLEADGEHIALLIVGNVEADGRPRRFNYAAAWKRMAGLASQYTAVEIVPIAGEPDRQSLRERFRTPKVKLRHLFYALLAVGSAFLGASLLEWALPPALFRINNQNVGMLFMIACAFAAGRYGLAPGLVASAASFLTLNYHFTAPYENIGVVSITDALNMALFLAAALLISLFVSQTREHAERAAKRELSTQALFVLYRIASSAFSREQALEKLQNKLTRMLGVKVAFFLPSPPNIERIEPAFPGNLTLEDNDRKALEVCWSEMKTTGVASPYNPGTPWRFEPMIAPGGEIGVLGVLPRPKKRLDAWFGRLLSAIADQTGAVLERIELERSMEATRLREEREKLRAMLLSSVSHDLKTPLASIIGSLSIYGNRGLRISPAKRKDLIGTALEEAMRLDSFITNILDMTRLESGEIEFKQEWLNMQDILKRVIKRMRHRLAGREVHIECPAQLEVYLDVMTIEQVIQNLLDNICKYTPAHTRVDILCAGEPTGVFTCEIRDYGNGLPQDKLGSVFDKYARLQREDSQVAGTGLGLTICKYIVEAQDGKIFADNHPEGGARFTFSLPLWRSAGLIKQVA